MSGASVAERSARAASGSAERRLAEAYRHCARVTRLAARNFYYGIRLLPAPKREAMCAVYAFARRVDDIGDGELPREEKLVRLAELEAALAPSEGPAADPMLLALGDARERFPLPAEALSGLIEGVRMDVLGTSYERYEELVLYCERVAAGVGRLCLAICGVSDAGSARPAADALGVALQLTNILRDLREDAEEGRVYLPRADLRRFGLVEGLPGPGESAELLALMLAGRGRWEELIGFEAERAEKLFAEGATLCAQLDRRSAACVLTMAGIYRRLLARIQARPLTVFEGRMSLSRQEKAWVAARSLLGAGL